MNTSDDLNQKLNQLAAQVERVTIILTEQAELLSNVITNTPNNTPKRKGQSSVSSSRSGTPRKTKAPHDLELVDADDINYLKVKTLSPLNTLQETV